MKKEELFEGAIVLARRSTYERRSRCRILEIGDKCAKIKKDNITFYDGIKHLRPAKITLKGVREMEELEELRCSSLKEYICNKEKVCFSVDADIRVILNTPMGHLVSDGIDTTKVHYMHEIQREIKKLIKP